jgi:hypothetical protein
LLELKYSLALGLKRKNVIIMNITKAGTIIATTGVVKV